MSRSFKKPGAVLGCLYSATLLGTLLGLVQVVQIPLGALPADSQRLSAAPIWHFLHVLGGAAFGLLGPIQFSRVLMGKYGKLHRVMGRVFVAAGAMLSFSALSLLWHFPDTYSWAINSARLLFGIALGMALSMAMLTVRKRDFTGHRNWMIRAYAIGAGTTLVSMIFFPIYLATGMPPEGAVADLIFVGSWIGFILGAEILVRRI